jgi:3-deoxy-D-manno-octulosonic-acid transferase
MSQKSFERYRRAQSLFQPLLAGLALIATAGRSDQRRFLDLGAAEDQTLVVGNPKFDNLVKLAKSPLPMTERPLGRKVLVAGSTEGDEDQLIVAAWKNLDPRPHLILAPRHLGRLPLITNFLKGQNLTYRLFSEREGFDWPLEPEVLVIDSMGQLAKSYAVADLAIVGGSFWAGQGHNPLEPAAYGVPVIFGPHMDSFSEESADLIAAGAAKTVLPPELSEVLTAWLAQNDPVLVGSRGRELLANREPLGPRLAALVGRAIKAPSNPPM